MPVVTGMRVVTLSSAMSRMRTMGVVGAAFSWVPGHLPVLVCVLRGTHTFCIPYRGIPRQDC